MADRARQIRHDRVAVVTQLQDASGRCIAAGMDDYIAKPVTQEMLHATLSKWLPTGDTAEQAFIADQRADQRTPTLR